MILRRKENMTPAARYAVKKIIIFNLKISRIISTFSLSGTMLTSAVLIDFPSLCLTQI